MRKTVISLVVGLFCNYYLFAQSRGEAVRVKAGENAAHTFSPYGFYQFPAFSEGTAFFKNGDRTTARFNYHILNEEIQFISLNGDTLALADPLSIKYITVDSSLFYYSEGYLEVVSNYETVKLARKLRLNVKSEKIGGYGQPSPSGSIRTPGRLILRGTGSDLSINEDIIIQKEYTYYWLDKYSTAFKATKANLLKFVAPDKKSSIEDYLKKNRIDFNKEADLKKLTGILEIN